MQQQKIFLPLFVFIFISLVLSVVQLKAEPTMLLLERLIKHGGWFEILLLASYGAIVSYHMQNIKNAPKWRSITWTIFSIWFFTQLFLGIVVSETFLLTGKLHLPVPAMIIGGPLYRGQFSVMTILFLSTLLLSGSAWCSHLCYFGAIDGLSAKRKQSAKQVIHKQQKTIKFVIVFLVIITALVLRWIGITPFYSTLFGLTFGAVGLAVILNLSGRKGKMVHCTIYCPVGTLVNYLGKINPFRLRIESSCTNCMACIPTCRYDALNIKAIENRKPAFTCTLCGDCLQSCHTSSFQYKFLGLNANQARNLYLFITISLHAIFMGMGRI